MSRGVVSRPVLCVASCPVAKGGHNTLTQLPQPPHSHTTHTHAAHTHTAHIHTLVRTACTHTTHTHAPALFCLPGVIASPISSAHPRLLHT